MFDFNDLTSSLLKWHLDSAYSDRSRFLQLILHDIRSGIFFQLEYIDHEATASFQNYMQAAKIHYKSALKVNLKLTRMSLIRTSNPELFI